MSVALVTGTLLIVVPVAFDAAVFGIALLIGTLEFVSPNEERGWPLAGTIVPIAYIAWSAWLCLQGIFLVVR